MTARVRALRDRPVRADGDYVLYWMIAARRTRWSFALDHALARARELRRPLFVLEPLRIAHPWASRRVHRFVLDGMADQRAACAAAGVRYHAYVEPADGDGKGLLAALARRATLVVTDEYPCFFLPRMVAAAADRVDARIEVVDGYGLLPFTDIPRAFPTASGFRRHLQGALPRHLGRWPSAAPLTGYDLGLAPLPPAVASRWPAATDAIPNALGDPPPVPFRGGSIEGGRVVDRFLESRLARYGDHNDPDAESSSELSPYLHFGHVSAHEVVARVLEAVRFDPDRPRRPTGSREGWWGVSEAAESFLDEIVTWRELGAAFCRHEPRYDRYDTLPAWARQTLAAHAADPRPIVYDEATLAAAATHDPLWNAAQRQLRAEGRIHNYLRMLWGKKILEWSPSPEAAWERLVELNNGWSIDGRDPNSYAGIAWTLGRFDRAWGPERPIFGTIRYMSSENTRRKLSLTRYLSRWGDR